MDVFLSGKNGIFSEKQRGQLPNNMTQAEENSEYVRMAIQEAVSNPKETILGWMQKFDSQIFDVQKVPHLPSFFNKLNEANRREIAIDHDSPWLAYPFAGKSPRCNSKSSLCGPISETPRSIS